MNQDFLTLEEAARRLNKSTQTIRRMIKKGDLKAQRIKTPQGFHYVVTRDEILFSNSPIQNIDGAHQLEEIPVLINQNENPTNQNPIEPIPEPVKPALDKTHEQTVFYFPPLPPAPGVEAKELLKHLERQHREQLGLIRILEQLQGELFLERQRALQKPKTLWQRFIEWLGRN